MRKNRRQYANIFRKNRKDQFKPSLMMSIFDMNSILSQVNYLQIKCFLSWILLGKVVQHFSIPKDEQDIKCMRTRNGVLLIKLRLLNCKDVNRILH